MSSCTSTCQQTVFWLLQVQLGKSSTAGTGNRVLLPVLGTEFNCRYWEQSSTAGTGNSSTAGPGNRVLLPVLGTEFYCRYWEQSSTAGTGNSSTAGTWEQSSTAGTGNRVLLPVLGTVLLSAPGNSFTAGS